MRGKNKFALHPLDYRCERFAGLIPISFAEPNTSYSPIRAEPCLGRFPLYDNADESFTIRVSLLDSFCDRRLQTIG
jgi:hypothetical protein